MNQKFNFIVNKELPKKLSKKQLKETLLSLSVPSVLVVPEIRLCKDCIYAQNSIISKDWQFAKCGHVSSNPDLASGKGKEYCNIMRSDGLCGATGRFWSPTPTPSPPERKFNLKEFFQKILNREYCI